MNHRNFLEELLKEGLLVEDMILNKATNQRTKNGVSFSYERIIDHFRAKSLINEQPLPVIRKSFEVGGKIHSLFWSRNEFNQLNIGVLNSLAILLPEQLGLELYELMNPSSEDRYLSWILFKALLESIIWRRSDRTSAKLWEYLKEYLDRSGTDEMLYFYSVILHVCANKGNFFNANFIHQFLRDRPMAERDHIWSIPISHVYEFQDDNIVKRLIDWCWSDNIVEYKLDDETRINIGKTLSWLFTNHNRYIRDKATKAFVALFQSSLHLIPAFIREFENVNDQYVLERIMAGVYGSMSRSSDSENIRIISQMTYDMYFKSKKLPTNILTRDYCKNIVELAIIKKLQIKIKEQNLYPPFKTEFPANIPDVSWIRQVRILKKGNESLSTQDRGLLKLIDSVTGFSDFNRYVIGTNHRESSRFSKYTLESKKSYEKLVKLLSDEDRDFLDIYINCTTIKKRDVALDNLIGQNDKEERLAKRLELYSEMKDEIAMAIKTKFSRHQYKLFCSAFDYIESGLTIDKLKNVPRFDLDLIARYILKRTFDFGWTKELFGEHDCYVNGHGREAAKEERVGKKYQWIAYYEIMAFLSDHYEYLGRFSLNEDKTPYWGTWQLGVRNIDPTILLNPGPIEDDEEQRSGREQPWWSKSNYNNWNEPLDKWLTTFDDVPAIEELIEVREPDQQHTWYVLNGFFKWSNKNQLDTKDKTSKRELCSRVTSFIVPRQQRDEIFKKGFEKIDLCSDIQENTTCYEIFHSELYEAKGYKEQIVTNSYPYSKIDLNEEIFDVIRTVEDLVVGDGYDCSGKSFKIIKPSRFLFNLIEAQFGNHDGCVYDKNCNIIGFDTWARYNKGTGIFLVRKDIMDQKLKESELDIIWHFCGEKEDMILDLQMKWMKFSGFVRSDNGVLNTSHFFNREK